MITVVGDLVEDVVVWLDGPLEYATDSPATRILRTRGGSAANTAARAAGIGTVPVRFIGCVGADPSGDALAADLAAHGVEAVLQRRGRTGTVVVLVDPSGERSMVPDRGAATLLSDIPAELLDGTAVLHVPAYGLLGEPAASAVRRLLVRAERRRIPISLDASSVSALRAIGPGRFLALVDRLRPAVLFANADEARLLGLAAPGYRPPPGCVVVIKDGARPARVRVGGSEVLVPAREVPGFPARPAADARESAEAPPDSPATHAARATPHTHPDTTGAGDAFAAGYLVALVTGTTAPEACAEAGHAAAADALAERARAAFPAPLAEAGASASPLPPLPPLPPFAVRSADDPEGEAP